MNEEERKQFREMGLDPDAVEAAANAMREKTQAAWVEKILNALRSGDYSALTIDDAYALFDLLPEERQQEILSHLSGGKQT